MKVIDLLNKMARGEKVPKRIDYMTHYNETLEWCDLCENYEIVIDGVRKTLFEIMDDLQDDLLIIEDTPVEDKKIEKLDISGLSSAEAIVKNTRKLNEIIDRLNGEDNEI